MGRPKSFNPDQVLDKALHVFWDKGYEAASICDLVEAMGINRFSLYDTFGDKQSLFIAAFDKYLHDSVEPRIRALESGSGGVEALASFLTKIVDGLDCSDTPCACMMVPIAVSMKEPEIRERVERHYQRLAEAFESCLQRARDKGQVRGDLDPHAAAAMLLAVAQGAVVAAAAGRPQADIRAGVQAAISSLRA